MSKDKPHESDCSKGPDGNHVYKRLSGDGFECVYCNTVHHFDIFDRKWE